jgi:hypothetical protein
MGNSGPARRSDGLSPTIVTLPSILVDVVEAPGKDVVDPLMEGPVLIREILDVASGESRDTGSESAPDVGEAEHVGARLGDLIRDDFRAEWVRSHRQGCDRGERAGKSSPGLGFFQKISSYASLASEAVHAVDMWPMFTCVEKKFALAQS